jgi:hypothetical protein
MNKLDRGEYAMQWLPSCGCLMLWVVLYAGGRSFAAQEAAEVVKVQASANRKNNIYCT